MEDEGSCGVWLNKHALSQLELPVRHHFMPKDFGWEIRILSAGKITARFTEGRQDRFDVQPGDYLIGGREEIYLAVSHEKRTDRGEEDRSRQREGRETESAG